MYAFVQKKLFTTADVPEDLAEKREKLAARVEKKKEEADKPKTVNKARWPRRSRPSSTD